MTTPRRFPLHLASATFRTTAHVPERLDPDEPAVTLRYRYLRGCAASSMGPEESASVDLLGAARKRDGVDVLPGYRDDRELMEAWNGVIEDHARARSEEMADE